MIFTSAKTQYGQITLYVIFRKKFTALTTAMRNEVSRMFTILHMVQFFQQFYNSHTLHEHVLHEHALTDT